MIVLDANVVSEVIRTSPAERVIHWISSQPTLLLYTTSMTRAEVFYGMEMLTKGKKKKVLEAALSGMFEEDFRNRVLAFDSSCAQHFAEIGRAVKPQAAQFRNSMRRLPLLPAAAKPFWPHAIRLTLPIVESRSSIRGIQRPKTSWAYFKQDLTF
jgi:predicted nucleic acid-binding protein